MEQCAQGWQDSRSEMQMTLRYRQAQERERQIRTCAFEVHADGDKSLMVFDRLLSLVDGVFRWPHRACEPMRTPVKVH